MAESDVLCSIVTGPSSTARVTKTSRTVTIEIYSEELFNPDDAVVMDLIRRPGRKRSTQKGVLGD